MTILGELNVAAGDAKTLGRVAYACQEPWMFTGSVRSNVVFDSPYDADRYRRVIYAAAMERVSPPQSALFKSPFEPTENPRLNAPAPSLKYAVDAAGGSTLF